MTGYPTILQASAELPSVAGMVENRSAELSVGMLSPLVSSGGMRS